MPQQSACCPAIFSIITSADALHHCLPLAAADYFGLEHIASGDLVRDEIKSGSELGNQVRAGRWRLGHPAAATASLGLVRAALMVLAVEACRVA